MMNSGSAALLDVNFLIALAWPNHLHHVAAREWFEAHREKGWLTCPQTEASFVRISTHPRIGPDPRSVAEAVAWLVALRARASHRFLSDDLSFATSEDLPPLDSIGHRQITDAHLLALARRHGLTLVTFDRGISRLRFADEAKVESLLVLDPPRGGSG